MSGSKYSESTPIIFTDKTINGSSADYGGRSNNCFQTAEQSQYSDDILQTNHEDSDRVKAPDAGIESMSIEDKSNKDFTFSKIPRRKKIVLLLCITATFLAGIAYSILGPFFPLEAEKKGLNYTMIGFVYGVFQLATFLASPFIGNFMMRAGVKCMFNAGIFIGGVSAILFGVLNRVPGGPAFIAMCILVRFVEACGIAAFTTACMTIVTSEFQDHTASVLASLHFASGAGNLVGPPIAGVLYDLGGFGLPFYCVAVPILLNGLLIYKFLPPLESENSCNRRKTTILDLMRSPLVLMSMLCVFVVVGGMHFFLSSLAERLVPFDLNPSFIGLMYTIGPLFFIAFAPVWGHLVDVKDKESILTVAAFFGGCMGWWLGGPCTFMPFIPFTLWTVGVSCAILGTSAGCLVITPLKCMVSGAYELHYAKDPDTFALVSGLYNSTRALGGFCGPFLGGALVQAYGFPVVFTGFGCAFLFMSFLTLVFFSFLHVRVTHSTTEESQQP